MRAQDFPRFKRVYRQLLAEYRPFIFSHLKKYRNDDYNQPSQQQANYCATLYKFDKKQCLFDWRPSSDMDIGGDSTSEIYFHEKQKYLTLKGQIDTRLKNVLYGDPYVGMKMFPHRGWAIDLYNFNLIRLKMRTYGEICRVQFHYETQQPDGMNGYGVIVDQTKQWQEFQLPLVHFRKDKYDESIIDIKKYTKGANISGLCLKIASDVPKEVQLDIQKIELLWVPYVQIFCKQYQRPIFYHRLDDYRNVRRLFNGREQVVKFK